MVTTDYFVTIKGADGVFADAKTPRVAFTLHKAILMLGGLQARDKAFDGTDKVAFDGAPTLSVKKVGEGIRYTPNKARTI